MKRLTYAALVTLFFAAAPSFGGIAVFGSYWDTEAFGESAGVGVRFRSDDRGFAWELRGGYFPDLTEDLDQLLNDDGDLGFEIELEAIPIDLGVVYQMGTRGTFSPYAGGGVTYFLLDSKQGEVRDEVGYYALAGFELGSGTFGFVAEATYRVVEGTLETDVDDFGDVIDNDLLDDIDLDLGGYGVNVGVIIRF